MNIFNLIIGVFVLAKLIGKFLEGYGSNSSSMPNQSNNTRRITKPILYNYSNELTINASLLSYYTKMLNLNNEPEINFDVVNNHYYSIFEEIEDARDLGHRINIDFQELISAREYMCDMCRYYGNRN
jgi:hypothetical protein